MPQPDGAVLNVPKGFKVNVFAEREFKYPRWMALAPNGDVFVADSGDNAVIVLRDADKDGRAEERFAFSEKFAQPFGLLVEADGSLLITDDGARKIWRVGYGT